MIVLAITGWLLVWIIILGIINGVMAIFSFFTGNRKFFLFIGFLAGIVLASFIISHNLPDETVSWTQSYKDVLVYLFTTIKGWFVIGLGIAGWFTGNILKKITGGKSEKNS